MYHNPEKLAEILGIPKLPDFTQEDFSYPPIDDYCNGTDKHHWLLSEINQRLQQPATSEELQTVLELFKMGMHYTQHRTGKDIIRNLEFVPSFDGKMDICVFASEPEENYYVISFDRLARLINNIRIDPTSQLSTHHAPRMGLRPADIIVVYGAEETHHAVTHAENPEFHLHDGLQYIDSKHPIPYYKKELELAFGKFLPGLVSDFGFAVTEIPILTHMDQLKGELTAKEYTQLYRERLEQKIGFRLPGDEPDTVAR